MKLLGKVICFVLRKHRRGVRIYPLTKDAWPEIKRFACPRCNGNERRYKIRERALKPPIVPPVDEYERDHDDDYKRQDAESRQGISNHDMTEDQRLDDPRHGQADSLNRENR